MKLFANSQSPFVRKVRICLYEKGLDFEIVEIGTGAQREALWRVNPRGEVPALQDESIVVAGSALICDYLEEKFHTPVLLPIGAAERARCRSLERIADTHTDVLQFFLSLVTTRRPEIRRNHPEAELVIRSEIDRHYEYLNRHLAGRDYFVGVFSRADIAFIPHITGLVHLGHPISADTTHLAAWLGRMMERASVQRDGQAALAAWQSAQTDNDPFFRSDRIHWRGERVEWALRFGLGRWLVDEVEAGRAFFSNAP